MTLRWNQPRRYAKGQIVFLRAKIVETKYVHPFDKGDYAAVQLIDKRGNPIDEVIHVVRAEAPITVAEALRAVQG